MKRLLLSLLFLPAIIFCSPSALDTSFANPNGYTESNYGISQFFDCLNNQIALISNQP